MTLGSLFDGSGGFPLGGAVLADEMEEILVGAGFRAVETLNHGRKEKST